MYRVALQNGGVTFLRVYMETANKDSDYYIHIYDDAIENSIPETAIHEHPFCFKSVILQGSLSHTLHKAKIDHWGEYLKVNYIPGPLNALGTIERIDGHRYSLKAIKDQTFKVGDTFGMGYDEIHDVTSYENITITNMKVLAQRPGHSYIYMTYDQMAAVNKRHEDQIALNVEAGKKVMDSIGVSACA